MYFIIVTIMYIVIRFYNNTCAFEILHLFDETQKAILVAKRYSLQKYGKDNVCEDMTVKTNLSSNNVLSYFTPFDVTDAIIYAVLFLPSYITYDEKVEEPLEVYYDNREYTLPDDSVYF